MKHDNTETKKVILSLLLGGVIGLGIAYSMRSHKPPVMKKIGRTVSELGDMLQHYDTPSQVMESIEHKLPNSAAVFNSLSDWINTGFELWKTLKKG